ncbi:hypothetical protein J2S08_003718 [Bacillus chungangensis]|uniref:Uncharacterized protein n=1 Tax=Bacillus chungangensis TaxID=587633 RepID=A0ABT9WY66_9BACI|nr:hypothetical protein [Bacillus chungangensis]
MITLDFKNEGRTEEMESMVVNNLNMGLVLIWIFYKNEFIKPY